MFINKTVVFFLFISTLTFPQAKKKVDTIFVHEKVFVYKTISKKIRAVSFDSITKIKLSEVKHFKIDIVADTSLKRIAASIKMPKSKRNKKWFEPDKYGVTIQSLFSQMPETKNYGAGIGVFVTKDIYKQRLFLNFEFLFSKVFGVTNLNPGYYITPEAVLFYKPKDVTTQQINLPVTVSFKYKKIKPQIGIAYTRKQTESDFLVYRNNTDLITNQKATYNFTSNYLDFVYGLEYEITSGIGVFLKSKQTLAKINSHPKAENLKSIEDLHFFPNQLIFGVNYNFKK